MAKNILTVIFLVLSALVIVGSCVERKKRVEAPAPDPQLSARVHNSICQAIHNLDLGRQNEAFIRLKEAEADIDTLPPRVLAATVPAHDLFLLKVHMANIYTSYHDFGSAAKYYDMSLPYAATASDSLKILLNMAVVSSHSGDSSAAADAGVMLSSVPVSGSDSIYKAYATSVAKAYFEKFFGNRNRSRQYFEKALAIARRDSLSVYSLLTPVSELYEWYSSVDSIDGMLRYLDDYRILAETSRMPEMMADVSKGYLRANILRSDSSGAISAYNGYFSTVDSLYNPAHFSAINARYNEENLSRTNDRMMRLELTVSRQKMIITAIIASILLILLLWVGIRRFRLSRRRIVFLNSEIARQDNESSLSTSMPLPEPENDSAVEDRHRQLMLSIYDVLADHNIYCDPEFNINTLASLVGSNSKYVSQAINVTTGENFRTFINTLRVKIARTRLTDRGQYAGMTIQAISESVGFKSTSNFVLAFKKVMGITPSAYQKLAR